MRTAPAPNMVAIPGMNPGVIVAGGGGGAGGGGKGSGKGGKDGNGNDGSDGGDDAEGGHKDAADGTGSCGGSGGCANPQHGNGGSASAGDPVDVVTGRVYTLPAVDLALPGPLPLTLERRYNSLARSRDVGLGFGWSHSYAWHLEIRRRRVRIWTPEGTHWQCRLPKDGGRVRLDRAVLDRFGDDYFLFVQKDGYTYSFPATCARGRIRQLESVKDRYGSAIRLQYDGGVLSSISDSVGRVVAVRRAEDGRISAFEVLAPPPHGGGWCFRRYRYDARGDLVAAVDAEGHAVTFTYDDVHLMVSKVNPDGFSLDYRYDRQGRCVESWGAYPGLENPALSALAPAFLADGSTPAKGMFHVKLDYLADGFTEVVTSRTVRRYHGNTMGKVELASSGAGTHTTTFDRHGEIASYTDPQEATWTWERDELGNMVRATDPLGHSITNRYDERGSRVETTDQHGVVRQFERDEFGALLSTWDQDGQRISNTYDAAGRLIEVVLPNGGITRMSYDMMGNRVEVREPNGGVRRIDYDYLGRVLGMIDELGGSTRYAYGARGELVETTAPNGARALRSYDRNGRLERFTTGDGRTYELRRSGNGLVHEVRRPDGTSVRYRYDREGDLAEIENEKGEKHLIQRSAAGYIVGDQTFDGRGPRYSCDGQGQLTKVVDGAGDATVIEYDALGRVVGRSYPDGAEDVFSYDAVGRLIASDNGRVKCTFEYDLRGNLVREIQAFGGETHVIEREFDPMGKVTSLRTSAGHAQTHRYDLMGGVVQQQIAAAGVIRFQRDLRGFEVSRVLPGGGGLRTARDGDGLPRTRRLLATSAVQLGESGEPGWVGQQPAGTLVEQGYDWSPGGTLVGITDSALGRTEFKYDPVGQLTARIPTHAPQEAFTHEPGGNLHEKGGARIYDLGGRLIRRGNTEFKYDRAHRLIEKTVSEPQGTKVWRYEWDGRSQLSRIVLPDGRIVENAYDSHARRIEKRVLEPSGAVTTTRYVWDDDRLVHKFTRANDNAEVEETTYSFLPGSLLPLAHRQRRVAQREGAGTSEEGDWVYYVEDYAGRPEMLVAGDGSILSRLRGRAYGGVEYEGGAAVATDLRFVGHQEDEETGLFYNRYRFYDPETGRYLSPEPLGLLGGLRPFGYAENDPVGVVDPDGLAGMFATASGGGASATRGSSKTEGVSSAEVKASQPGPGAGLHPAVQAALQFGGERDFGADRPPEACAEPRAISDYLYERVGEGSMDDPEYKARVDNALQEMTIEANQADNDKERAPCANCSQLIANLQKNHGGPKTSNVVAGGTTANAKNSKNFTPPKQGVGGATSLAP